MHIVELHKEIEKAQENNISKDRIRTYTAAAAAAAGARRQQKQQDVITLLKTGMNSHEIVQVLGISLDYVESQRARMDRHNEMKRRYLTTGDLELPKTTAVFPIFR